MSERKVVHQAWVMGWPVDVLSTVQHSHLAPPPVFSSANYWTLLTVYEMPVEPTYEPGPIPGALW